jgi:hypothetical protein
MNCSIDWMKTATGGSPGVSFAKDTNGSARVSNDSATTCCGAWKLTETAGLDGGPDRHLPVETAGSDSTATTMMRRIGTVIGTAGPHAVIAMTTTIPVGEPSVGNRTARDGTTMALLRGDCRFPGTAVTTNVTLALNLPGCEIGTTKWTVIVPATYRIAAAHPMGRRSAGDSRASVSERRVH